jgi:type VI secretion system secreted protein VgrG
LNASGTAHHDNVDNTTVNKVVYKPRTPQQDKPHSPLEDLLA